MDETPTHPPTACTTRALAELLRRWRDEGDLTARTDLLNLSQERVELVARKHLRHKFLDLKANGEVVTATVQNEAYLRMRTWVEESLTTPFPSVAAYFGAVRTVIHRVLADFAREHRHPRKRYAVLDDVPAASPDNAPPTLEVIASMWELVHQLPERERQAVELRLLFDLKLAEVAEVMGLANTTAAFRLVEDGKRMLRELAAQAGFEG